MTPCTPTGSCARRPDKARRCTKPQCREANRRYNRNRHKLKQTGRALTVPADTARARIHTIRAAGWTLSDLERATGVDHTTLLGIASGRHARIKRRTHEALARVTRADLAAVSPARVPVFVVRRYLDGLALFGFPGKYVLTRAGLSDQVLNMSATHSGMVTAATAAAVRAAFRDLWGTKPAQHGIPPKAVAATIAHARKRGAVPWLAWDDPDDPAAVPDTGERGTVHPLARVHIDEVERLAAWGENAHAIARACHVTVDAVEAACRRHGRVDLWHRINGREAA